MGLDLGTLSAKIEVKDDGVESKLSRVERKLQDVDKAADQVSKKTLTIDADDKGVDSAKQKTQQLGAELDKTKGKAESVRFPSQPGKEMDVAKSKAKSLGDSLGSVSDKVLKLSGAAAGGALLGGLGTALTKGFNRLNSIDQATAKLEALGNSASDVETIMDNALSSVKGTAYGIGEAAGTAATMVASGVEPGKELEGVLKGVADSAAIAGVGMDEMGLIWGKAAARGKLDGELINQMLERQIPIYDILAEKTGHTAEEITDMVSQGKISFEEFSSAMNDYVGGGAVRMGETFQGSLANMGAALGRLGAAFLEPAFEAAPGAFDAITGAVDGLTSNVEPLAAAWGAKLGPVVEDFANNLGPNLAGTLDTLGAGFSAVSPLVETLASVLTAIPLPVYAAGIMAVIAQHRGWTAQLSAGGAGLAKFTGEVRAAQLAAASHGKTMGVMNATMLTLGQRVPTIGRMSEAFRSASSPLMTLGHNTRMAGQDLSGMARFAATAKGSVQTLGGVATGVANGGMSLLKSGASGFMTMLGGPWGLAIGGATLALTALASEHQKTAAEEAAHKQAQEELKGTLDTTTGAITEQTTALQAKRAEENGWIEQASQLGLATGTVTDAMNGNTDAINRVNAAVDAQGAKTVEATGWWQEYGARLEENGVSAENVSAAIAGSRDEMNKLQGAMTNLQSDGVNGIKRDFSGARQEIEDANGSLSDFKNGVAGAAEDTDKAAESMRRMALEGLFTGQKLDDVFSKLGDTIVGMPDEATIQVSSMAPEVKKELEKLGLEVKRLDDGTGRVNIQFPDGFNIIQMLDEIGAKVKQGEDGRIDISDNTQEVKDRLVQLGLAVKDEEGNVTFKDNIADVISKQTELGVAVKDPKTGQVYVKDNIGQVRASLDGLGMKTQQIPSGQVRVLDNADAVKGRLEALGVKTINLPGGRVAVIDNTAETHAHLEAVGAKTTALPGGFIHITDTSQENMARLESLEIKTEGLPDGSVVISENADAVRNKITTTLSSENTSTQSSHTISIIRRIRDIFENANGGIFPTVQTFDDGGVTRAINRRARGGSEPPHTAHIAPGGSYRVFAESETGGEAYIPLAASKRARSEHILGQVAEKFGYQLVNDEGQVQTFADGGISGAIKRKLRFMDGTPYVFGGWSPAGVDCTGATALVDNARKGKDLWSPGRFATGNMGVELRRRGWRSGRGHLGDFVMAWLNGGPGGGHAAAQLPDGTFVESGGNTGGGFTIGRTAGPLSGRGFTDWMHFPGSPAMGREGLSDYSELGDVAGPEMTPTTPTDSAGATEVSKTVNGGAGTLIKDGSFLELVAAMHSKTTGTKYADDITSWGQVAGVYTEVADSAEEAASRIDTANQEIGDIGAFDGLDKNLPTASSGNKYADAIIKEGRRRGITDQGIQIALATALVESGLKMYANHAVPESLKFPHDAVGSDHDSVGLFQQRQAGWGTLADRMDPAKSAGMFYDKLDDANYNEGDPGAHAQRVQVSAFPDRYNTKMEEAGRILARFNGTASKVKPMADGGILGHARNAQINDGSSAVLWAEAGPEAYIPLSSNKRARSIDIWAETGKRLGIDVMSMLNLMGGALPGLTEGKLNINTGASTSMDALGLNMEAAAYRGGQRAGGAIGAVFNGPVQINDPRQFLQAQLNKSTNQLRSAMRSVGK